MLKSLVVIENRLLALKYKDYGNLNVVDISKKELEIIKQDLEVLEILKNYIAFYSSESPKSEWCDLIGLGKVSCGPLDTYTPSKYYLVKKWYYQNKVGDNHD